MDKPRFESPDMATANINKISEVFPGVVTEGKVNFDLLRSLLGVEVYGDEAYEFTWVGKKAAIAEAGRPIRKTLRPCVEESKNWDTTENLYIEGDNLDVLKLLQESYLGKVKMIYIDPPYNTGNDFLYRDNFTLEKDEYDEQLGIFDEDGDRLFRNTESNGRFHSDWCSMIYPRLVLARNLLTADGIILMSIDDAEVAQLRKITDEIFGERNFVACLVYDKNRKNDAKYFSVGHEYMLVYFKSAQTIYDMGLVLRAPKEGVDEVKAEFMRLRKMYKDDWEKVNEGLKALYASWPKDDERKPLARFTKVDEHGPFRDDGNISWPGGGGPKYEVLHPITGKPCKVPDAGWRFPNPQRMQEEIKNGRVVFGPDETTLPRIRRNLFEADQQVMRSVIFSYAQTATMDFNKIFDNIRVFENPKSTDDIKKLISYITNPKDDDIILDFFSGSATTAHAVMQLNAEDGGKRKFIMVQLPEPCAPDSEAAKAGYANISEIGKERIRRAGGKIKEEAGLTAQNLDIGFRVLKLDSTNMQDVYYAAGEYNQDLLLLMEDNIKDDRTDMDLLYACLLDWGLPLSMPHTQEKISGFTVHNYNDGDLIACFDKHISDTVVKEIAMRQPLRAVFRDNSFAGSPEKINVEEIFKLLAPNTSVRVI
ncbi:site-specific DNA-methyltransferase [Pelotomaculum propionicicum]|uniref:site-specific DNA-methyltransferase n=1 Tax=Pelotomaculum propionicicum TaxID=258475 RepID=UPI003B7823C5